MEKINLKSENSYTTHNIQPSNIRNNNLFDN